MTATIPTFTSSFFPSLPKSLRYTSPNHLSPLQRHTRRLTTMTAFRKYHGLGNDFILLDNRAQPTPLLSSAQSTTLCNRHRGIGADGVIFLLPPANPASDFCMRLYNSDGSEAEMCGNGIRCLAKFASHLGIEGTEEGKYVVDTHAGTIVPQVVHESVCVDMGEPILVPQQIPTTLDVSPQKGFVDTLSVQGMDWKVCCVSMGNPHAVIFVEQDVYNDVDAKLERLGPHFESNPSFPARTNTEFVYMRGEREMDMVVWERGAGRTMACGTGACAVVVAAVLTGRARKDVDVVVHLPGGDLTIKWISDNNRVLMTGPAEFVFEGNVRV